MSKTFSKPTMVALAACVLASFALAPVVEAANRGGGGGGGGGGARASAGGGGASSGARSSGGGRQAAQVNNTKADARSNDARSSSVNNVNNTNVNVNKNVNVNVQNGGGCCNNGWDNDHPIATVAAVTATVAVTSAVIGSIVNKPPTGCAPVNYGGMVYQQCGSTWYAPQGSQYIVVAPPY